MDHGRLHDVVQLLCLQDARVHGEVKQYKGDKDDGKSNKEVGEKDTDKDDLRQSRFKNYIFRRWQLPARCSSESIGQLLLRGRESLCPLQIVKIKTSLSK